MIIDREITIKMAPREDGGLRVWSDDLPGLILSKYDQGTVLRDLGTAIAILSSFRQGYEGRDIATLKP